MDIENVGLDAKRDDTCTDSSLGYYCNSGGLVLRSNATFTAKNSSFANSWQQKGGVVYGEANTTVFSESSIFHDNYAKMEEVMLSLESGSRSDIAELLFQ